MSLKFEDAQGRRYDAVVVHNQGHEGAIVLDKLTGIIVTPNEDRPDWAGGLAVALLSEHRQFYTSRLGPSYNTPDLFDIRDLGFIGVNEQGDEIEVSADYEFRMDYLAAALGLDREEGTFGETVAEVEISMDHLRGPEEIGALEDAGAELTERTGTRG
jgi:hypothetical protein